MVKLSYSNALNRAFLMLQDAGVDKDTATYLLLEQLDWTNTNFEMHKNDEMSDIEYQQFMKNVELAENNTPPQYILGYAWFYGKKFKVSKDTLIPRQDTEMMVEDIIRQIRDVEQPLRILDIGTGTGIIAITLAENAPQHIYTASDISKGALKVAEQNAKDHKVDIEFVQSDLFDNLKNREFDVIVSNPPYIAESEKVYMDKSVIDYEPDIALYAENNGLSFYERISSEIRDYLDESGKLFLEYGFKQKSEIRQIFNKNLPEVDVQFKQDLAGNDRYLQAQKKEML